MMWYDHNPGWGGWLLMTFGMVAFWALVIVAVVALVRALREPGAPSTPQPTQTSSPDPLRLLDERFARGEMDVEDYRTRRELLAAHATGPTGSRTASPTSSTTSTAQAGTTGEAPGG